MSEIYSQFVEPRTIGVRNAARAQQ